MTGFIDINKRLLKTGHNICMRKTEPKVEPKGGKRKESYNSPCYYSTPLLQILDI